MSQELRQLRLWLEKEQTELAHASLRCGQADAFNHGVEVGKYAGYQAALDKVVALLRDEDEPGS